MLQVWRSVSRGCFLPVCLSSPPPSRRERDCPTSPPVSPLTLLWWWANCPCIISSISPSQHRSSTWAVHHFIVFKVCSFVFLCVAAGTWCSSEMSGQEESGSGAGRPQRWSSYPAVPRLHTVRHTNIYLWAHTLKQFFTMWILKCCSFIQCIFFALMLTAFFLFCFSIHCFHSLSCVQFLFVVYTAVLYIV